MATLFAGILITLGRQYADLLLRYTIAIAAIFAMLGILEFFILIIYPGLVSSVYYFMMPILAHSTL